MKRLLTPSPAMVVAVIALMVALSGTAVAAGLIRGGQIANRTITGNKLKNGTIAAAQVRANALTGGQVRNGSLTGADIRKGSITADRLAPGLLSNGSTGPTGPAGSTGPRGSEGQRGSQGDAGLQGPPGPSQALAAGLPVGGSVETAVTPVPIGKIDLPPGQHVVIAKLTISSLDNSVPYAAICTLTAGPDSDSATVSGLAPTQNLASTPVTLTIVHSSQTAGPATVACADSVTQGSSWKDLRITAIKVGSIATLPAAP